MLKTVTPTDFEKGAFKYALPAQYYPPDYGRHEIQGEEADKQLFLNNWKIETEYEFILDCVTTVESVKNKDEITGKVDMKNGKVTVWGEELSNLTKIYFTPNDQKTISTSVSYEDFKDKDNTDTALALTIAPTTADFFIPGVDSEVPENKEYVKQKNMLYTFIVDRSGSMSGPRMQATKEAMTLFLRSLDPDANFCVISFGSKSEVLSINHERILNTRTH